MTLKSRLLPLSAALIALLPPPVPAESMPASLQEMWKIIQKQQKEIENLKAKAAENEALKKEVKELKATQEAPKAAAPAAVGQDAPAAAPAPAASAAPSGKAAKTEVERKTDILASEVQKLKTQLHIPEKREYKSEYGFGPAASEVYRVNRGLSIGGYGEWFYTNYSGNKGNRKDTIDNVRTVLYVGYKFNDWIILNNEIEFEHASTGEGDEEKGEVSVEFSQLDFLLSKYANIRAGLMLVPMGFINEIHEPTTFHGNRRPDVERYIIPTTWREMGAGLFGEIVPGLTYRMYAMNSLNAKGYESIGIREGRQGGSESIAENWAFTGRMDYTTPELPGFLIGASTFIGDAGQGELFNGQRLTVQTWLSDLHIQWHYKGLEFRALGAYGTIGNAADLSRAQGETIGNTNYGLYTELAYDIMPWLWRETSQYLAPFFRYERYNSLAGRPDGFSNEGGIYDRYIYQGGLTYKPIQNISVKLDYRNIHSAAGQGANELNMGLGFIY
jgi:hypothetical protein